MDVRISKIISEMPKYQIFNMITMASKDLKLNIPEECVVYLLDLFATNNSDLPLTLVEVLERAVSESGLQSLLHFKKLGDGGLIMSSVFHRRQRLIGVSDDYYASMSLIGFERLSVAYPKSAYPHIVKNYSNINKVCRKAFSI